MGQNLSQMHTKDMHNVNVVQTKYHIEVQKSNTIKAE